jgi:hypothetical protein
MTRKWKFCKKDFEFRSRILERKKVFFVQNKSGIDKTWRKKKNRLNKQDRKTGKNREGER